MQAGGQILPLFSQAANTQASPSSVLLELQHSSRAGGREAAGKSATPCSETSTAVQFARGLLWLGWAAEQKNAGSYKCPV